MKKVPLVHVLRPTVDIMSFPGDTSKKGEGIKTFSWV